MSEEGVIISLLIPLAAIVSFAARSYFKDRLLNKSRGERIWRRLLGGSKTALWLRRLFHGFLFYSLPLTILMVVSDESGRKFREIEYPLLFLSPLILGIAELILWKRAISRFEKLTDKPQK